MQRYFIEISYNGGAYHGWQIQENALSIQEVLNYALQTVLRFPVETTGSGRTDTGVHAIQQFVHFDSDVELSYKTIQSLNAILPHEIAVKGIYKVKSDANARYHAISRTYQYFIHFNKNPFLNDFSYQALLVPNLELMNEACEILKTYSNFEAFSKNNTQIKTHICIIQRAIWTKTENGIMFEITADRFLRNMVRAIVGTMLQIGNGTTDFQSFKKIIENKSRAAAGFSVPACGLFLTKVHYSDGYLDEVISR